MPFGDRRTPGPRRRQTPPWQPTSMCQWAGPKMALEVPGHLPLQRGLGPAASPVKVQHRVQSLSRLLVSLGYGDRWIWVSERGAVAMVLPRPSEDCASSMVITRWSGSMTDAPATGTSAGMGRW